MIKIKYNGKYSLRSLKIAISDEDPQSYEELPLLMFSFVLQTG